MIQQLQTPTKEIDKRRFEMEKRYQMKLRMILPALLLFVGHGFSTAGAQDTFSHWNQYRGANGDGVSTARDIPVEFDEAKNVRWKTAIPESGWSSPVVWENEIWLTSGSDQTESLRAICVDLKTGKITKNVKVFDMVERKIDQAYGHDSPHLNSPATPTPVVERDRVFVSFGSQGVACLDRTTGEKQWERRDLRIYQPVRQGSSPIVDDENLYVAYDGNDQQFFIALDKKSGETRWKVDRNVETEWDAKLSGGKKPGDNNKSFATAQLIELDGKRQLIAPAAEATISYDPNTGKELWRAMHPGGFNLSVRPIFANGLVYVFTSGITHDLMAIRPDGKGDVTETHVAWSLPRSSPNIPSPVLVDGLLFLVTDNGVARCLDAQTGEEIWKKRLGGDHWASPILIDGKLYFSSKQGDITVFAATRAEPEPLARNTMNAQFIASPAVAGSSLILRSTTHLYCVESGHQRTAKQVAADVYPDRPSTKRNVVKAKSNDKQSESLAALGAKLKTQVKAGKITVKDAIEQYQTAAKLEAAYEKLLQTDPSARKKIEDGLATKADVIEFLKNNPELMAGKGKGQAKSKGQVKVGGKRGARDGSVNFYAVVIGKLKSKDIELGELELEVNYVLSNADWPKKELVGQRVKLVGVSGAFLDNLLQIKRGETMKVRTGDYNFSTKVLGFGYKFQVLERTSPFKPQDFGVPPNDIRGYHGQLVGKVVEALGYEVLLDVQESQPGDDSKAKNDQNILGKRVRIAGFYGKHSDAFADLHEGDKIRVGVAHRDAESDAFNVTDVLSKVEQ